MNEHVYQYAVLRYMHDPATQEFLNVGIVLYSSEARFIKAAINKKYARLSCTFQDVNGDYYRRVVTYLEQSITQLHINLQEPFRLFGDPPADIKDFLRPVLPPNDSSLFFGGYGSGIAGELEAELQWLYDRLVTRYAEKEPVPSRNDEEVWQAVLPALRLYNVTAHLSPVTIQTETYEYEFDHAWKNERWHPIEPVSFDLMEEASIMEKAIRWVGRTAPLADNPELGTLYMVVGSPRRPDPKLRVAYQRALQSLTKYSRVPLEIVPETDMITFSEKVLRLIEDHDQQS